jgi:uncharacterized protein YecE (DUF72 family)
MAGTFFAGTSGWAYAPWKGRFYPARIRPAEMLPWYATQFRSVEVNYTFRTVPPRETLAAWRDAVPERFVFALKAPQRITHFQRLSRSAATTKSFLRAVSALGERRGPVLFQCPPNFKADLPRLRRFLKSLPEDVPAAFEFRHESWAAARPLLAEHRRAWCEADDDERPVAAKDARLEDAPFAYVRLRRESYSAADLRAWAKRFRAALASGRDVYCYLKHEDTAKGARWALELQRLVAKA